MASAEILDFKALLEPIGGDNPAGEALRYSTTYDAIQEARRAEDDLPMGEWQHEVKTADWRAVMNLCTEASAKQSKDLQIAAWLTEALVKRYGFAGLRDGLRLLREWQEAFWDGLYPEIEDGDLEFRSGPLNWLNEKLPAYVREVPLTESDPPYSWNHWDESRKIDNLGRQNPEAMQAAIAEGKLTGEQFDKSVDAMQRAFYENLLEDLDQSKGELSHLEKTVDEKFGRSAPSLIKIRNALDDCYTVVDGIVKKKRAQDPSYRAEAEANADSGPGGALASVVGKTDGGGATSWAGEPRNREEAFQRLAVLANYLKRAEPQHPVSYLLERAVRWTKMPFEQWLGEVINNQDVLNHLRDTLGIKDREDA